LWEGKDRWGGLVVVENLEEKEEGKKKEEKEKQE
jgi:hypothetical protein